MKVPAIHDALKATQGEQSTVVIFIAGAKFEGIVTRLEDHIVEIRAVHGSTRTVIVLDQITAVSMD